jgi:hypothetical protein
MARTPVKMPVRMPVRMLGTTQEKMQGMIRRAIAATAMPEATAKAMEIN